MVQHRMQFSAGSWLEIDQEPKTWEAGGAGLRATWIRPGGRRNPLRAGFITGDSEVDGFVAGAVLRSLLD
jgi:hypothetical protein